MYLYRDRLESYNNISPEEMQTLGHKWQAWVRQGLQDKWMVDAGHGLKTEGCVVDGKRIVTDGPFMETKEIIGGYAIVQAPSINAAAEHAKSCPILLRGGSVEVRPLWDQDSTK